MWMMALKIPPRVCCPPGVQVNCSQPYMGDMKWWNIWIKQWLLAVISKYDTVFSAWVSTLLQFKKKRGTTSHKSYAHDLPAKILFIVLPCNAETLSNFFLRMKKSVSPKSI